MIDYITASVVERGIRVVKIGVVLIGFVYLLYVYNVYLTKETVARQSVVCPSYLSIARSSRDTLIVMRNDPLCNRFVLENLQ